MGTTILEKLLSAGSAISGNVYRLIAGNNNDEVTPISVNHNGDVNVGFSKAVGLIDSFNRFRVSNPQSILEARQTYDDNDLLFVTSTSSGGSASYQINESLTNLTITGTSGSTAIRQTREYVPYEPGHSQLIFVTGVFNSRQASLRQRMGYFDTQNGIFLEQTNTGLRLVRRTFVTGSAVDNQVEQANWSFDSLDGNGPSEKTFDETDFIIMVINFGWLGGASVRVSFLIDGVLCLAHEFSLGLQTVFMTTPNLPVRWEITNTAAGSAATLKQICCSVQSEGGAIPKGIQVSESTPSEITISTTLVPIISVRLKSAYSRGIILPLKASGIVTSNDDVSMKLIIRGSLTGASWNNTTSNATEFDVSATAITGGVTVDSFFINNNGGQSSTSELNTLTVVSNFAGTADILTLAAVNTGGSADILGSLTWREVY